MNKNSLKPIGVLPKDGDFVASSLKMQFCQNADTCGQEGWNEIDIETMDSGAGIYYVIKTDRWAIDSISELVELLKDFEKRINTNE